MIKTTESQHCLLFLKKNVVLRGWEEENKVWFYQHSWEIICTIHYDEEQTLQTSAIESFHRGQITLLSLRYENILTIIQIVEAFILPPIALESSIFR